ncbi:PHA/PHB synthase family protein [Cystobacter fuscus]|uniref:PHA/PHB synthase family protein n=1 Tax=Cystobacter fuscus TaxID=43 RepID=UPI0037C19729
MNDSLEPMRRAFVEVLLRRATDPQRMMAAGCALWERSARLWFTPGDSRAEPSAREDRRFRDPAWVENPFFDLVRRSYLMGADWLQQVVADAPGVDEHTAHQARFYARQLTEALSPSNIPALNPEVLRGARESGGRSLLSGLEALLTDLERGQGWPAPRMTDTRTFELGKTLAITPGEVLHEDSLFQLIQYRPTTPTVYRRPLLVVPPWINKYYILDLRPENSFIRWAVARGYTVFLLSWVNPDERHADVDLEHYLLRGLLPALEAITRATGEQQVSALGYCIGGTLLSAALAWLAARGDERIQNATLLTTQVDFSEPGDLAAFIDEPQLERLEARMRERGYLDGADMMSTFNLLRAKDLFWSFVVNNYLLGREPPPSDFLYWSSDPTRLPARAHATYLRGMYLRNLLVQPGGLSFDGTPLDLGRVRIPLYVQACREDHIAPFRSVYRGARSFSGPVRFVLAGSGHVAGVINPPAAKKYRHWVSSGPEKLAPDVDTWLAGAEERPGSWWTDWDVWLSGRSGEQVTARLPGDGALRPIEPAPGRYVRQRILPE